MGKQTVSAQKHAQNAQTGEEEAVKPFLIKLKHTKPRATTPELETEDESSKSLQTDEDADDDEDDEDVETEQSLDEDCSATEAGSQEDGEDEDEADDDSDDDDSTALEQLDDVFYEQSTQGITNPILTNATYASDSDWEDFFRLVSSVGNREVLNMVKVADPTSTLNIKRVINMVYKGQSRLAKIRNLDLEVVKTGFKRAREINGVRDRQQTIRKATMKKNGTTPRGNKGKGVVKTTKKTKKTTTTTMTKKTPTLDKKGKGEAGPAKLATVPTNISEPSKTKEELEVEEGAKILVGACEKAWKDEAARLEAAETLLLIGREPRDFGFAAPSNAQ